MPLPALLRLSHQQPEAAGRHRRPGSSLGILRGIHKYLVVDTFPAAVAGPDPLHPRLTRGFLKYSQHRDFVADPALVPHPRDKPKVEPGVQYVREHFFKGSDFNGLPQLRTEAQRWCEDSQAQPLIPGGTEQSRRRPSWGLSYCSGILELFNSPAVTRGSPDAITGSPTLPQIRMENRLYRHPGELT